MKITPNKFVAGVIVDLQRFESFLGLNFTFEIAETKIHSDLKNNILAISKFSVA